METLKFIGDSDCNNFRVEEPAPNSQR